MIAVALSDISVVLSRLGALTRRSVAILHVSGRGMKW